MRIICTKFHQTSKHGTFHPGKTYSRPDEVALQLLKDFPDRFKEVVARGIYKIPSSKHKK